jgi:hypothetical protein
VRRVHPKTQGRFDTAAVAALAERQWGVVSRQQLLDLGVGDGAVNHRLRIGGLHTVHRGVYAVGHSALSARGRWSAAVLAGGHGARLSHRSCLALMALRQSSRARVEITVPSSGGRARPGLLVHRTRRLGPDEVAVVDGIPCTSWARTVVDASAVLGRNAMRAVLRESEVLGLFDLHALTAALAGARGRRGVATLAALVQTAATESAMTRSVLEDSFLELCAVHGLPRPEVNVRVHGHEVDFLFRTARLVVETDGHAFHRSRDAFELDRRRDARLMLAGYRVLRLTWSQVEREGADVARTLRRLGVSI